MKCEVFPKMLFVKEKTKKKLYDLELCDIVAEGDVKSPVIRLLGQPSLVNSQLSDVSAVPGVSLLNVYCWVTGCRILAIDELKLLNILFTKSKNI